MAPPDSDPSQNDPVARPRRPSAERPPDDESPFAGFLPRHWAMSALLAVNCFVALMLVLAGGSLLLLGPGDLLVAGAVFAPRVWDGEIWRLLTACFLHVGVWHLALNMFVLWQVGRSLEELTGGARALLVYIASGVFGFAVSVLFSRGVPSAGASGAVFGVVGAVVAIAVLFRHRRLGRVLLSTLMPFVVGNLALGFLVPFIDNAAHIGGFVLGFVLGYGFAAQDPGLLAVLLQRRVDDVHIPLRTVRIGNAALVLAGLLFLLVVPYAARPFLSPLYHAERGLLALDDGKRAVAQEHLAACARLSPSDPSTLFLSARLREESDKAAALKTAQAAIAAFDPDPSEAMLRAVAQLGLYDPLDDTSFAQPRAVRLLCDAALALVGDGEAAVLKNQCAWLLLRTRDKAVHDPARALVLARAAVKDSDGADASILHTLADALAQTGQPHEGLLVLEKLGAEARADELPGGARFLTGERKRLEQLERMRQLELQRGAPDAGPTNAGAPADAGPAAADAGPAAADAGPVAADAGPVAPSSGPQTPADAGPADRVLSR